MARTPDSAVGGVRRAARWLGGAPAALAIGLCCALLLGPALAAATTPAGAVPEAAASGEAAPAQPRERPATTGRLAERLPLKPEGPDGGAGWTVLRVVTMLAALAIALVAAATLQRRGLLPFRVPGKEGIHPFWGGWLRRPEPARALRVVQSLRLTPRATLHLVRLGEQELLIGASDQGVELLHAGPAASAASPGGAKGKEEGA